LNLPDGKVWMRRLVFPTYECEKVAEAFIKLQPPDPRLSTLLMMMRSPPGTPSPGAPLLALSAAFFGSAEDAEKATAVLLEEDLVNRAINVTSTMVPFANLNDGAPPSTHGGYKGIYSCFISKIGSPTIQASFEKWVGLGTTYPDAMPTMILFIGLNPQKQVDMGETPEGRAKSFQTRNRGIAGMFISYCSSPETQGALVRIREEMIATYRQGVDESPRAFANNIRDGMPLQELYHEDMIGEIRRVKTVWDPNNMFWSPYGGDGMIVG
jgi:hypothetical protein